jgi:hypothetical protein
MLNFEINIDDIPYLGKIKENYPDNVFMMKSKNFDGSKEIIEIIITLTPAILSSVAIIMNNLLHHRISKMESEKNPPSEISFKVKNNDSDFEFVLKSSTISNIAEIDTAVANAMNKIKEISNLDQSD